MSLLLLMRGAAQLEPGLCPAYIKKIAKCPLSTTTMNENAEL